MKESVTYGSGDLNKKIPDYRDITLIYNAARDFMEKQGIEPMVTPNVPGPKVPGALSTQPPFIVETNVHGIKFLEIGMVYRYHMDISYLLLDDTSSGSGSNSIDGNGNDNGSSDESNGNGGDGHLHSSSPENGEHSSSSNGDSSLEDEEHIGNGSKSPASGESMEETKLALKNLAEKRIRGDPGGLYRRHCIRKIYFELFEKFSHVFDGDRKSYYFDLANTLYTCKKLQFNNKQQKTFEMKSSEHFFPDVKKVIVTLQETGSIKLGNFKPDDKLDSFTNLKIDLDYPLVQFLEIASSQSTFLNPEEYTCFTGGKTYLNFPEHFTFSKQDTMNLPNACNVGIGSQKSVRFVEGPKGRGYQNCGVVVENKKTPFHLPYSLADKAYECCIVGLYVENAYAENGSGNGELKLTREPFMRVHRINIDDTPTTKKILLGDREMTVLNYYREVKNHELKYPQSPLAEIKFGSRIISFPLEALLVYEHQRVTTEKQTPDIISQLIKMSAILPNKMSEQFNKNVKALELVGNEYLKNCKVDVTRNPMKAQARCLIHPMIIYKSDQTSVSDLGSWNVQQATKFIIPGGCKKWVVTYISEGDKFGRQDPELVQDFVNRIMALARTRGMELPHPLNMDSIRNNIADLEDRFIKCKKNAIEFAFFISNDRVKNMHDHIKLFECKYELATQDLNSRTMENVVKKNQRLTLENILMKTNVKLGGLNHAIVIEDPEYQQMIEKNVLYVGFGMNHPAGGMRVFREEVEEVAKELQKGQKKAKKDQPPPPPPTIVGFAANDGKNEFEFIGDYVYQPARRDEKVTILRRDMEQGEDIPVLQDIFETILTRFKKNRGFLPNKVVVYRNGCSEGQFANVLLYEVPIIKHSMKKMKCEKAKLTFIVPNKLHNIRLIPAQIDPHQKAPQQNIKPGYVIDTAGTAKVPRFTVLYTDDDLSADMIQQATYALAYGHQIVRSPTSIPSPAYIAGAYAERGRKVVNAFMQSDSDYNRIHKYYREELPEEQGQLAGEMNIFESDEQKHKISLFNRMITLHNKETLRRRRINA